MLSTDFLLVNMGGRRLSYILGLLFFILTVQIGSSQESITCNGKLQISLGGNCQDTITAATMLKGEDQSSFSEADYTVSINGLPSNIVSAIGTYEVTVTRISDNNSCWGTIYVEDKSYPLVTNCQCPPGNNDPACAFACSDEAGILNGSISVPTPNVTDCSAITTVKDDIVSKADSCGQKTITRSWKFTDAYGHSATCVQEFRLNPVDLDDIDAPIAQFVLGCGNDLSMQSIYNAIRPTVATDSAAYRYAYPSINGQPLKEGVQCNLAISKKDDEYNVCDQECSKSKKIVRTWKIYDWCLRREVTYVQIMKAADTIAPTIIAEDFSASTDPWKCTGTFYFPAPKTFTDNCTDPQYLKYSVHAQNGATITWDDSKKLWKATNAPKGTHEYYYQGEDCCGNIRRDTVNVMVKDNVPPTPISKEYITVTLTTGGIAKIKPESVDNGSHDACGPVYLEIRRDTDNCDVTGNTTYNDDNHSHDSVTDTDDGQFVKFCCKDATSKENDVNGDGKKDIGYIKVWLRVWDDGDMDGKYGTAGDNYNETWTFVKVENKILPKIKCPDNVIIECDADENDTSVTGVPTINSICGDLTPKYEDTPVKNKCNTRITRRWYIEEYPSVTCTQIITKTYRDTFDADDIIWPDAHIVTNCADTTYGKVPTWNAPRCAQVGYSLKPDTFTVEADACLKIINRWTVIDWCQYSIDNSGNETGIWRRTSIIKVVDNEKPQITCKNEMFDVNDHNDADKDSIVCERKNVMLTATATDNGDCPSVWLKWTVFVDLYGDGKYDYEYTYGTRRTNNSFTTDVNNNGIPDVYLAPTRSSGQVKITLPDDIPGSMATHKVRWVASDGCGNQDVCNSTFMVVDKKAPTPYCVHISSALMKNGSVELWAKDFDKGSYDNCTSKENLRFTFTSTKPSEDNSYVPAERSSARTFICDDLKNGNEVDVTVYVWDEKDLYDFCSVKLTLLDNQEACGPSNTGAAITGVVTDPKGQIVKDVEIRLQSSIPDYSRSTKTNDKGEYAFSVKKGLDYKISGHKNDGVLKGVNTLDLVLMQRHILELKVIKDPYQLAAADINNDKKISPSDLLALRKVILDINDAFPNGQQSYIVVDAAERLSDTLNPWAWSKEINIQKLSANETSKNFTIFKIGDVNKDASQAGGENTTTRSTVTLPLETEVTPNNVQVFAGRDAAVAGLQLAIDLRGAELLDVTSDILNISRDMYNVEEGILYLSIVNATNIDISEGDELFRLITNETNTIGIAKEEVFSSEAYIGDKLETAGITISSRSQETFALEQNKPNPFKEATMISYTLPTAGTVSLRVYDLSGRIVLNKNVPSQKGYNAYSINMKAEASGVYYYTLQSGEYTATKKMIIIE